MSSDPQHTSINGAQPAATFSPYALEFSIGGVVKGHYSLRSDKPTWIGRRPHHSHTAFEYIHIPWSTFRYHCLFEWDAKEGRFGLIIPDPVAVWINGEDVVGFQPNLPKQPRPLNEGDVIILSEINRGPYCVRVTLVKISDEKTNVGLQEK